MLINSNNEWSTLADTESGSIRRAEDLVRPSAARLQSSPVGDRRVAPLVQQQSSLNRQKHASELQALRQAAYLGEQQKQRSGSIRKGEFVSFDGDQHVGNFAAPLSPLRDRDLDALSELFLTDQMSVIEADVAQLLIRLQPEPCWEDDPLMFLREFL
ncbi:hypothetical protein JOY44_00770 [Phormidium sp. CLA17]|uniref:hypothetical protein n=1 Tax=Leptolyngbya sp. Cla-17 TaxID=2803751 RepID=UPI0018D92E4A|nr:hypothetical protein [Leptolyngbya sp. Cla-17]MBM0740188.1 hypothetical protein [Leptolyngbya sp. Cla-17]